MLKMKISKGKELSKEGIEGILGNEGMSKSGKMIELFVGGLDVKSISILMDVRYNFVYNVVSNYMRKEGIEDKIVKDKRVGVKEDIFKMVAEGKSNIEISRELKCNYNMVWKYRNELEKGKIE